ncbi:hypothetical protein QTP88_016863 [Uroleucon formosanum]
MNRNRLIRPGFTQKSFEAIKKEAGNHSVYCNLVIDEMCIRQQVEIDSQQNIHGYINTGAEHCYDSDDIPLAKNALVFLAVGINGYWKMPLAYFLIDGLGGEERANLLQKAINLLHDTGAKLKSTTFVGANVNTRINDEKNFIFLDRAHMLKLIRNAWEHRSVIKNANGEIIDWVQDFIETTFSAIRSRLGYNDNPTCMQFKAAYKRILVHNEAVGSIFGNYSILDNTKNLSVTEKAKDSVLTLELHMAQYIYIDHDYFENYTKISSFVENTSFLIQQSHKNPNSLINIKNRGGLVYPSKTVEILCQESEKIFRSKSPLFFNQSKNKLYLINKVKTNIYKEGKETVPYCTGQESFLN